MADNVIMGLEKIKGTGLEWRREGTMERWNDGTMGRLMSSIGTGMEEKRRDGR